MAFKISKENKSITETNKNFKKLNEEIEKENVQKIPLSKLSLHPDNEKIYLRNEDRIWELSQDIKENGLHSPLNVVKKNDIYLILSGNTRYLACELINYDPVDVIVRNYDEFQERKMLISSNSQREKTLIEKSNEIQYLKNLYEDYKIKFPEYLENKSITEKIAEDLEVSISTVQRAERLNELNPELKNQIKNDKISASSAQRLADIDEETQKEIAKTLNAEDKKINKEDTTKIVDINKEYEKKIFILEDEIKSLKTEASKESEKEKIIFNLEKKIEVLKADKKIEIKEVIKKEKTNIDYVVSSIEDLKVKILKDLDFLRKEATEAEEKEKTKNLVDKFILELEKYKI